MVFFRGRFGIEAAEELSVADVWAWTDGWG
jgi:hypothetical protein